jgi:uncharacterized protein with PIN domain
MDEKHSSAVGGALESKQSLVNCAKCDGMAWRGMEWCRMGIEMQSIS